MGSRGSSFPVCPRCPTREKGSLSETRPQAASRAARHHGRGTGPPSPPLHKPANQRWAAPPLLHRPARWGGRGPCGSPQDAPRTPPLPPRRALAVSHGRGVARWRAARGACWGVRQGRRGEPPWGQPGVVASPSFPGSPLPAAARGVAKDRPLGTRAVGRGLLTDPLVVGRGFSAERGGCKVAPAVGTMGGRPAREGPPPPPLQPLCFFPSAAAALCACLLWQRCLG